jgi:hypothetical protein
MTHVRWRRPRLGAPSLVQTSVQTFRRPRTPKVGRRPFVRRSSGVTVAALSRIGARSAAGEVRAVVATVEP